MAVDSTLIAAALLLGSALHAAVCGAGVYLRFAAMLCAALALAVLAHVLAPGLAAAVALPVLPLAGAGLGLSAIARWLRPVPPLPATLVLVTALACGLLALSGANLLFALLPLLLAGVTAAAAALHRAAVTAALAGLLLASSACAFLARGVALPGLLLLAAGLTGFAVQARVSTSRALRLSAAR